MKNGRHKIIKIQINLNRKRERERERESPWVTERKREV